jgi:hypothetical protein
MRFMVALATNRGRCDGLAGAAIYKMARVFCTTICGAMVLFYAAPLQAQNPSLRYAAQFDDAHSNDSPAAIAADAAGNTYVTGQACVDSTCADQEALTIKYGPNGNVLWKAWLKSPVGVAQGIDIGTDAAGNSYVLFLLWQKRGASDQLADPDVVTAKYNAGGVRQWVNYISSTATVTRTPVKLAVSPAGNVYVTTIAAEIPANSKAEVLTIKYGTNGATEWAQAAIPTPNTLNTPLGVQLDSDENVYVLLKSVSGGSEKVDSLIFKYAASGAFLKSFGGEQLGSAMAFQVSPAGNSYAAGFAPTATPGATGDVTLAKFNADGSLAWANDLGSTTGSPAAPQPVVLALDPKEDVFLGSTTTSTGGGCGGSPATSMAATKFDTDGHQEWSSTYGESVATDSVTAIAANSIGDLYVMGTRTSVADPRCAAQILIVKFGISGRQLFSTSYTQDYKGDLPIGMAIGGQGGLFITGIADTVSTGNDWLVLDYVQDGGTISPSNYNFGSIFQSAQTQPVIFTLVNTGEVELTNISLAMTGTDQGFVMIWNNCGGTQAAGMTPLAPGGNCQFGLIFNGYGSGDAFGSVILSDNWTGSTINPQTIQLSGFVMVID